MSNINLRDVGPIKDASIPVPANGGVVVLRGQNGSGKSLALGAVENLVTKGNIAVPVRDGASTAEVSAFGAVVKMGRRLSRSGELEVASLEGRFSITDIVDPKIQDPDAADSKRIKALVQLADVGKPDVETFRDAIPVIDEYPNIEHIISNSNDLLSCAGAVKRELEKESRTVATTAERKAAEAKACEFSAKDVGLTAPSDKDLLNDELEGAIRDQQSLKTTYASETRATQARNEAQMAFQMASEEYDGKPVSELETSLSATTAQYESITATIRDLESQLKTAKETQQTYWHAKQLAERDLKHAEEHINTVKTLQAVIDKPVEITVTDELLQDAQFRVLAARESVETGVKVRNALELNTKALTLRQEANENTRKADDLRESAKATDNVLSDAVQRLGCALRIRNGRLVTDTDRGEELYADLSKGEKFKVAIEIAINVVGRGGVIVLDQEGWEGLNPANRRLIAEQLEGSGVVMVTAQCSDDEGLTPEIFESDALAFE